MKVIVLGAGVIGTTSAWYLSQCGHEVTVIDRQAAAGMETSFANGGQISVSHALPWANPMAPLKALRWLAREDAPLLFRLRADPAQWRWGLRFLLECLPSRTLHNTVQAVNLGLYSRAALQALRRETGIQYDQLEKGILHFYTSQSDFDAAQGPARVMREHGCDIDMLDPETILRIEPALKNARRMIVGASMARSDESGDAHQFTQALAGMAAQRGVRFLHQTSIRAIVGGSGSIQKVVVNHAGDGAVGLNGDSNKGPEESLQADAYLLALGSYSATMVKPLGIDLVIYPAKGYSVTLPVMNPALAHTVSLSDDRHKLVFSRLGNRLRIAGTAEFNGFNTDLNPVRCRALVRRAMELFPGAGDPAQAQFWTGLRPATPSNLPCIGRTRYPNLFVNTGHGTLGWTHACGSGHAIAQIISGRKPEVDFVFMS